MRALVGRGYPVLVLNRDEVERTLEIQPGVFLEIKCRPFEIEENTPDYLDLSVVCDAIDFASGERVYRGKGWYEGAPRELAYTYATRQAFWDLPKAGMVGGEIQLADLRSFWRRQYPGSGPREPERSPPEPIATIPDAPYRYDSSGTAFFVSESGHLLTNHHVIEDCRRLRLYLGNEYHPVTVVAADADLDLAILIWNGEPLATAVFRTGRFIRSGESVVAVGFPLRGLLADEATVTVGIVNSMAGIGNDRRFMQVSAQIQSGNSGGPLLDEHGGVVGVVVAKLDAARVFEITGDLPQNVNFAINGQLATDFLNANGVPYELSASTATLSPADIADVAKRYTVPLECAPGR